MQGCIVNAEREIVIESVQWAFARSAKCLAAVWSIFLELPGAISALCVTFRSGCDGKALGNNC